MTSPTTGDSALRLADVREALKQFNSATKAEQAYAACLKFSTSMALTTLGDMEDFLKEYDEQSATLRSLAAQRDELADCLRVAVDSELGEAWLWPESARKTFMANARALLSKVEQA